MSYSGRVYLYRGNAATLSESLGLIQKTAASLIEHERIRTTMAKAKELRPLAEKMITQGKRDSLHARRLVRRWVDDRSLIKKLFDDIAPRFAERPGGYTRIVKLGPRLGDAAEMAILEFVEQGEVEEPKKKAKGKK